MRVYVEAKDDREALRRAEALAEGRKRSEGSGRWRATSAQPDGSGGLWWSVEMDYSLGVDLIAFVDNLDR